MFALRHIPSNKVISFYTIENDKRDFCVSKSHYLTLDEEHTQWTIGDRDIAEEVKNKPGVTWAKADKLNPSHNFLPEELEIISL